MKLFSKLVYQARRRGLDFNLSDGVKLMNIVTKKYIHILPNGRICSEDILGQDKDLKSLMKDFLIKDPFSGSSITLPVNLTLHLGKGVQYEDEIFATNCLAQCFANIKNFEIVEDPDLLSHECRIEHDYALSYKKRQTLIKACIEYLK